MLAGNAGALAQTPAEFYKGKIVNMVVGFSPGGGYDQYARMLSRHMGQHIPGAPTIVVQNAPGAGSLTAVRRVEGNLPKDGTAIVAFNPALITESVTEPAKTKFKFTDVEFVGSTTRDLRVCFMWHATGVKTWDEVLNRKEVIFGSTGKGTSNYVNQAVLRNVFGVRLRQVMGYPGSADTRLSIERGELDGDCGSWSSIPDEWIREKKINTFLSFSANRAPDMPEGVPFVGDLAKTPEQKAIFEILTAAGELGRPYIVSKSVPADRLAALRAAFDATMKDKEFLAEAVKQNLPVSPVGGVDAKDIVNRIYNFPPDLLEKTRQASE